MRYFRRMVRVAHRVFFAPAERKSTLLPAPAQSEYGMELEAGKAGLLAQA